MARWTFDVKFTPDTQFTFGSLMFVVGDDGDLMMLPLGPAPKHLALAYGQDPWSPATSSTSAGTYSGLNPFAGCCVCTTKLVWGIPVATSILWPMARASSSSSSVESPDQDLSDDYPEIGISTCGDCAREGHFIFFGGPEWRSIANQLQ
jgi:hypothetical protein